MLTSDRSLSKSSPKFLEESPLMGQLHDESIYKSKAERAAEGLSQRWDQTQCPLVSFLCDI